MSQWVNQAFVLAVCAGVFPANAGAQELERFERQLEQVRRETLISANPGMSVDQRVFFDYGAYLTFAYASLDDNTNKNHGLRQIEFFPYLRANFDGAHEIFLRGIWGYRDFNPGDSFDGRGDEPIDGDLDRGYYKFDLARHLGAYQGKTIDYDITFKAGRDLAYWGNGLVLSEVIDGAYTELTWGRAQLDVLAGVTPVRTVDFDASRPNFDHNTRRGFYGGMLSASVGPHRPYAYGLVQRDYNEDETLAVGPVSTKFDYNSYYIGVGSSGSLSDRMVYGVEVVYEGGDSLSNSYSTRDPVTGAAGFFPIPQTHDQIQAYAADVRLDYLLTDPGRTRLTGEVIMASGDDDRINTSNTYGGNKSGTKDRAFNAFGLLNTGLAFAPNVSNLLAVRLGAATFPLHDVAKLRRLQAGTDVFVFGKLESDAPIDEPSSNSTYLGFEPDLYLNWQITSDVTFTARYGIFFPNSDALRSDEVRQFIYFGVTYGF